MERPSGTVTFLFTDIEGSTRLLHELGSERYADALAKHRRALWECFARHGGVEVDTQGDAFFVAFADAPEAVACAGDAQRALADGPISVRMASTPAGRMRPTRATSGRTSTSARGSPAPATAGRSCSRPEPERRLDFATQCC